MFSLLALTLASLDSQAIRAGEEFARGGVPWTYVMDEFGLALWQPHGPFEPLPRGPVFAVRVAVSQQRLFSWAETTCRSAHEKILLEDGYDGSVVVKTPHWQIYSESHDDLYDLRKLGEVAVLSGKTPAITADQFYSLKFTEPSGKIPATFYPQFHSRDKYKYDPEQSAFRTVYFALLDPSGIKARHGDKEPTVKWLHVADWPGRPAPGS